MQMVIILMNKNHLYYLATLMLLSAATAFGWTSPTLPILLGDDSPIPITPDESSWIVVAMVVGTIASPFPAALLMDKYNTTEI